MERKHFKTVVVSDLHLGSLHSKVMELTRFLESLTALGEDEACQWKVLKYGDLVTEGPQED